MAFLCTRSGASQPALFVSVVGIFKAEKNSWVYLRLLHFSEASVGLDHESMAWELRTLLLSNFAI